MRNMEKNWFIFENDHHVGPFSAQEIMLMHEEGRVKDETMIWREGNADWVAFRECNQLDEELLPELPPLPIEDELPPLPFEEHGQAAPLDESLFEEELEGPQETPFSLPSGPLEEEATEDDDDQENLYQDQIEEEAPADFDDEYQDLYETPDYYEAGPSWGKWIMATASGLAILASLYFVALPVEKVKRFRGLARDDFERLARVVKGQKTKKPNLALAMNRNQNELWLASNTEGSFLLLITLRSKKGRILSDKQVVATAEAILDKQAAHFKSWRLKAGERLVKGEYQVEVKAIPIGPISRLAKVLKKLGLLKYWDFAKRQSVSFTYKGDSLLYTGTKKEFESELSRFFKVKKKKLIGPLKNQLEFYRTLTELLNKIQSIYLSKLRDMQKGSDIQFFEKEYGVQVAPILQGIVLSTNETYTSLMGKDRQESEKYEKLLEYGKAIGSMAADMAVETRKFSELKEEFRNQLEQTFTVKAKKLLLKGKVQMQRIQKQIEQI